VRYWAALGLLMRGKEAVMASRSDLRKMLADTAPCVRIAAAEALGRYGDENDLEQSLSVLLALAPIEPNGMYVALEALNALDALGPKAAPGLSVIRSAAKGSEKLPPRVRENVRKLAETITANLQR
jgi:uncharacterized sulfatase